MKTASPRSVGKAFALMALLAGLAGAATPSARADTDFQARRMTRGDVPLGKGQCDIRLRVDGEVEVSVRGDHVHVRTISGRDSRDDGSECNEPLPPRQLDGFNFEVMDSRNEIKLLSEPERRNSYSAVVRIRDSEGGEGRYHFRLSWQMDGGGPGPGGRPFGNRFDQGQAINACSDAVRDRIGRDYRYGNVEIQYPRADERRDRSDWIIGDARARNGFQTELFIFSCQVDYNAGRVRSLDVRIR